MRYLLSLVLILIQVSGPSFAGRLPVFKHVFVVLEENHNYSSVIGSNAMPYLNSLASSYGFATQYYANTHPSIGNYFMLTTGRIITNNDDFTGTVRDDNVVRELLAAGLTWKAYEEDLPSAGYISPDVGKYARAHCPLSYLSDVVNDSTQKSNLVPFTQFAADLANNSLASYSFISPNLCNDAHDCPLHIADAWLQTNIDPLVRSKTFQKGDLLVIVFDESASDNAHGGGRIAWLAISPKFSKPAYQSATFYQQQDTLRLMMEGLGLKTYPGAAASASNMSEFFSRTNE
jgi:hypothetical protein